MYTCVCVYKYIYSFDTLTAPGVGTRSDTIYIHFTCTHFVYIPFIYIGMRLHTHIYIYIHLDRSSMCIYIYFINTCLYYLELTSPNRRRMAACSAALLTWVEAWHAAHPHASMLILCDFNRIQVWSEIDID